jgi:hypothetical protein
MLGRHNSLVNRSPKGLRHSSLPAAANSTDGRRGTPAAPTAPDVEVSAARGGGEGAFDLEFDEAMLDGPSEAEAEAALLRLSRGDIASPEEPHGGNRTSARPSSPPAGFVDYTATAQAERNASKAEARSGNGSGSGSQGPVVTPPRPRPRSHMLAAASVAVAVAEARTRSPTELTAEAAELAAEAAELTAADKAWGQMGQLEPRRSPPGQSPPAAADIATARESSFDAGGRSRERAGSPSFGLSSSPPSRATSRTASRPLSRQAGEGAQGAQGVLAAARDASVETCLVSRDPSVEVLEGVAVLQGSSGTPPSDTTFMSFVGPNPGEFRLATPGDERRGGGERGGGSPQLTEPRSGSPLLAASRSGSPLGEDGRGPGSEWRPSGKGTGFPEVEGEIEREIEREVDAARAASEAEAARRQPLSMYGVRRRPGRDTPLTAADPDAEAEGEGEVVEGGPGPGWGDRDQPSRNSSGAPVSSGAAAAARPAKKLGQQSQQSQLGRPRGAPGRARVAEGALEGALPRVSTAPQVGGGRQRGGGRGHRIEEGVEYTHRGELYAAHAAPSRDARGQSGAGAGAFSPMARRVGERVVPQEQLYHRNLAKQRRSAEDLVAHVA